MSLMGNVDHTTARALPVNAAGEVGLLVLLKLVFLTVALSVMRLVHMARRKRPTQGMQHIIIFRNKQVR